MNLLWRFIIAFFIAKCSKKLDIFDCSTTSFRVLPTDIDLYGHLNNGRYFSLMDIGRLNLSVRNGLVAQFRKFSIFPVIASEMIRFKKSLNFLQRFNLTTRLLGWDEKYFYVAQVFHVQQEIYAIAIVKTCLLQKNHHRLNAAETLKLLGINYTSPPLPTWINDWQNIEIQFYKDNKINF